MAKSVLGHWTSDREENLETFLKAADVSLELSKLAGRLTLHEHSSVEGDTWSIHITNPIRNYSYIFQLDKPFKETRIDGKTVKTTFKLDGDKLVATQEAVKAGDIPFTITREVTPDDELLITMTTIPAPQVTCKRWLKRDGSH